MSYSRIRKTYGGERHQQGHILSDNLISSTYFENGKLNRNIGRQVHVRKSWNCFKAQTHTDFEGGPSLPLWPWRFVSTPAPQHSDGSDPSWAHRDLQSEEDIFHGSSTIPPMNDRGKKSRAVATKTVVGNQKSEGLNNNLMEQLFENFCQHGRDPKALQITILPWNYLVPLVHNKSEIKV